MMIMMNKKSKPGDLFNRFQAKKKKKLQSEADAGSMGGYDPNLNLGKSGYARATAISKSVATKPMGRIAPPLSPKMNNANSTRQMFKKHKKNWIAGAIKKPGALHAELGIKKGNKIPTKTLAKAAKKGGKLGKRARLAETLKGFHHAKRTPSFFGKHGNIKTDKLGRIPKRHR